MAAFAAGAIVAASAGAQDERESRVAPRNRALGGREGHAQQSWHDAGADGASRSARRARSRPNAAPSPRSSRASTSSSARASSGTAASHVTCSKRTLDRRGLKGCPRESIVGGATVTARAGTVDDRVGTSPSSTGARRRLLAYTRARLSRHACGRRCRQDRLHDGSWRYGGTPARAEEPPGRRRHPDPGHRHGVHARRQAVREGAHHHHVLPERGGWRYRATAHYLYDLTGQTAQDTSGGTIACTS